MEWAGCERMPDYRYNVGGHSPWLEGRFDCGVREKERNHECLHGLVSINEINQKREAVGRGVGEAMKSQAWMRERGKLSDPNCKTNPNCRCIIRLKVLSRVRDKVMNRASSGSD